MKPTLRALSVFLAGTMLTGLVLTGCGDSAQDTKTTTTPGATAATAADPLKDPVEISVAYWDIATALPNGKSDALVDQLKKDLNISIKTAPTTWTDWNDKIKVWAAANDLPDIFATAAIGTPDYANWIKNGVIRALPADLGAFPNLKSEMSKKRAEVFKTDNKFYAVPRAQYDDTKEMTGPVVLVRKDYMAAAGITKAPDTVDEFVADITAMSKVSLDGKKNVVGLTSANLNFPYQFAMYAGNPAYFYSGGAGNSAYVKEDGKWIPAFFSKKTVDGIKVLKKMYDSGAFDKDFAINGNSLNGEKKFTSGQAAALLCGVNPSLFKRYYDEWAKSFPGRKFSDYFAVWHQLKAPDGNFYTYAESFWSESYFSSKVDDKKMDRICRLYDYLLSQQGKDLFTLGISGKDYTKNGDKVTITRPKDANGQFVTIASMYPSAGMFPYLANWYATFGNHDPANDPEMQKAFDDYIAWKDTNCKVAESDLSLPAFSSPLKDKFAYNDGNSDITKIILGKDDVDTAWAALMKKYEAAGYSAMVEEFNKNAKAAGKIN